MTKDEIEAIIRDASFSAARTVAKELKDDLKEHVAREMELHQARCPVKAQVDAVNVTLSTSKSFGRGAIWMISVVVAVVVWVVDKIMAWPKK